MEFAGLVNRQELPGADTVITSIEGHVGIIELNEPERHNPLGINEMHIHFALQAMHADADVRAVIITGRGRSFCAGADIRPRPGEPGPHPHDGLDWSRAQRLAYHYGFGNMWKTIDDFAKPLIAAVNGYALGGGWELAHLCDWIVASENAVFAAAEIDVGLIPYSSTVNYLTKMIGKHRAIDLVVNGTRISAERALELGLVNVVVPHQDLMTEARALAERISARPPITVAAAKQLVVEAMSAMEHHRLERALAYSLMPLEDTLAARRARSQNQPPPEFHGR